MPTDTSTRCSSLVRAAVALVALFWGCGQLGPSAGAPTGLRLALPADGLTTSAPAKVSLFFTIDTTTGAPVAGLASGQFELFEDGSKVSVFESQVTVQPKGQRYRMSSLLLLDLSGSVLKSGNFPALREAATRYIDQVLSHSSDGQVIALSVFDGRTALSPVVGFTHDAATLKAGLAHLGDRQCTTNADCAAFPDRRACGGWLCVDDSTNLNGAVVQGIDLLERELLSQSELPFKDGAMVLFTDGTDQAARVSAAAAEDAVNRSAVHTFTIGLGGEVDEPTLRRLGKDGYLPAAQATELSAAFRQIADRIVSLASRFYLLEYCSPKRSGTHTLEVKANAAAADGSPLTGSLTGSFDATGFQSGCELKKL